MSIDRRALSVAVGALLAASVALAQGQPAPAATVTTTTTSLRSGVVVYASGNTLVTKESDGVTREHTVPDGFIFQMGGKNVTLADLKPGDKISAVITETKTVQPVTVTRVVQGKVIESSMGSIVVQNAKGQLVKYSSKDADGRDIKIIQNGKEVAIGDLKAGDRLSATIVTKYPPQVTTERQVTAKVTPPPPAPVAAAPEPAAPATVAAAPKPAKLPKTASPLPLLGLVGGLLALAGAGLTLRRRSRIAR
jgi:LPXTG-motif cell wall-anchored protein